MYVSYTIHIQFLSPDSFISTYFTWRTLLNSNMYVAAANWLTVEISIGWNVKRAFIYKLWFQQTTNFKCLIKCAECV